LSATAKNKSNYLLHNKKKMSKPGSSTFAEFANAAEKPKEIPVSELLLSDNEYITVQALADALQELLQRNFSAGSAKVAIIGNDGALEKIKNVIITKTTLWLE
jgi:hypothetical protein